MTQKLEYPFTTNQTASLTLGEMVSVSGRIYTARDRIHRYLADGGECPVKLKQGAIYHCGPVIIRKDGEWISRAAGPTTSMRQEPYMAEIIKKYRIGLIIGKGGMGPETEKACAKYGCVYLQAVGGAAQVLNATVERVVDVHLRAQFGTAEAMWELDVVDFPAIVAIDAAGRSLHKRVRLASKRAMNKLFGNGNKFKT